MTAMQSDRTVSLDQALTAKRRLRDVLKLPDEQFAIPDFVGMISDEIEQLYASGRTDDEIAALINESVEIGVSADDIRDFYVPSDAENRRSAAEDRAS